VEIVYARGNRTEHVASLATVRKILDRFVAHRVFYEISSRDKGGHVLFSAKNRFVVGEIQVTNRDVLSILFFDAHNPAHSIEVLNPQTMRIYDDMPGGGFAVSFITANAQGLEARCYVRDEGEDEDGIRERTELERISLPQLFKYLEEIAVKEPAGALTAGPASQMEDRPTASVPWLASFSTDGRPCITDGRSHR